MLTLPGERPPTVLIGTAHILRTQFGAVSGQSPEVITADFVYFRLRKPEYTAEDVDAIASHARGLLEQGKDLFLMFKHEETPDGALHAEEVLRKVAG